MLAIHTDNDARSKIESIIRPALEHLACKMAAAYVTAQNCTVYTLLSLPRNSLVACIDSIPNVSIVLRPAVTRVNIVSEHKSRAGTGRARREDHLTTHGQA